MVHSNTKTEVEKRKEIKHDNMIIWFIMLSVIEFGFSTISCSACRFIIYLHSAFLHSLKFSMTAKESSLILTTHGSLNAKSLLSAFCRDMFRNFPFVFMLMAFTSINFLWCISGSVFNGKYLHFLITVNFLLSFSFTLTFTSDHAESFLQTKSVRFKESSFIKHFFISIKLVFCLKNSLFRLFRMV